MGQDDGGWTAIVLAGQRPGENSFAEAHGVHLKPLIPVAGEPMLGRVVRTLQDCRSIGRIVLLAQDPAPLFEALPWVRSDERISAAESRDNISTSIKAVAGSAKAPFPVLVTTADHALLRPEMLETFISGAGAADVSFALVERKIIEADYPQTKRTYLRFADGDYSGANLFAFRSAQAERALAIWSEIERDRKKAAKLLMRFGPVLAIRALTRTISLDKALAKAASRIGIDVRAVRLPFAQAAIDVDKESDLHLVEEILAAAKTANIRHN